MIEIQTRGARERRGGSSGGGVKAGVVSVDICGGARTDVGLTTRGSGSNAERNVD